MEFTEKLAVLREKIRNQEESIKTEEGTKNAFVMPFISSILGYDVFSPLEVVPEFTADVGAKKGEKVDYAIMENGTIRILIECKKSRELLSVEHASQLFRYFTTTAARIAILTNGEVYQFFTDLDKSNMMDSKPFLELDFNNMDETVIPELRKLTKEEFDLESVLNAAEELKRLIQPEKFEVVRRVDVNGDPFSTRIGLASLVLIETDRLACIIPQDSPARRSPSSAR